MSKKSISGTGRFGSRYGKRIREDIKKATKTQKTRYICPSCSRQKIRRESAGVWICTKCNKKYASGAYKFTVK